jgi:hypothetical protein
VYCPHESRSAKAALNRTLSNEGFLNIGECSIFSKTFNGGNLGINSSGSHDKTTAHGTAINNNGATATFALLTRTF